MKFKLLLLSICLTSTLFAADWELFPLGQKTYFGHDDYDAIDWVMMEQSTSSILRSKIYDQIEGTSCTFNQLQNGSSFDLEVYLNTYPWVKEIEQQGNLTTYPTNPMYPFPLNRFLYYADAEVGSSWQIIATDAANDYGVITFTCISKEYESVFGVMDSVKTFSLTPDGVSAGQVPVDSFQFIVSKNYGVLEYVPISLFLLHPPGTNFESYHAIGYQKQGTKAGIVPPSFNEYFNYQVGDILNWENKIVGYTVDYTYHRDSITSVNNTSTGVTYTYDRKTIALSNGNTTTYSINQTQELHSDSLVTFSLPFYWGGFRGSEYFTPAVSKNLDFNGNSYYTNYLRTRRLTNSYLCTASLTTDWKTWNLFDNRFGLVEYGDEIFTTQDVTKLIFPGPCPGITAGNACFLSHFDQYDCDQGGLSNEIECFFGTDPLDPTDDFQTPLPITLTSFTGTLQSNNTVLLEWETAIEINSDRYEIERSEDGIGFKKIGEVPAAGNSTSPLRFEFEDSSPVPGIQYYRLRMVDKDGRFTFSHVVSIANKKPIEVLTLSPNPLKDGNTILITLDGLSETDGQIILFDVAGKKLSNWSLEAGQYEQSLDLGAITQGVYIVRVVVNDIELTKRLIIY